MKSFLRFSAIAAIVTAAVALLSGSLADYLLGQWKADQAGWLSAASGFALATVNQVLVFPARIVSFGSDSAAVSFLSLAFSFIGWGLACAAIWRRFTSRRRAGTSADLSTRRAGPPGADGESI